MASGRSREDVIQLDELSGNSDHPSPHIIALDEDVSSDGQENEWDKKEGWLAVAAGSAIFFVYLGLRYSYGILQLHLVESRLSSVATLSFVGSVAAAISPLTSMMVARIIGKIGYRATAIIGSLLLGLGEFTTGWSTKSLPAMFATQGFLCGMGSALLFLVS